MFHRKIIPLFAAAGLLFSSVALADSLNVGSLKYTDVRVTAIKNGEVFFTTTTGNEVHKPLSQVSKISLNDEPSFSLAEEAYQSKDWDKATTNYQKTLTTTQKPWLREWCSVRLLESANNAGRFDAAIRAYVALAEKSPESAKTVTFNPPKSDSAYLPEAIKLLEAAVARQKNEEIKGILLKTLVDLHTARGDANAADTATQQLLASKVAADPNSPEAQRAQVVMKLRLVKKDLANKEYDKVLATLEKEGGSIIDPADQAEALLLMADARSAKAGNSDDPTVWKEVAIAYLRVVSAAPASPHAAAALLKVAQIHEKRLGEKQTALRLYEQVSTDFKDQDPAKEAEKEIKRLRG